MAGDVMTKDAVAAGVLRDWDCFGCILIGRTAEGAKVMRCAVALGGGINPQIAKGSSLKSSYKPATILL
jgi:hypothetical protein